MVVAIAGSGTSEANWQDWPGLHAFPALDVTGWQRVVLVAPHPDDEVLGVGGLVALLHRRGVPLEIVAVTDGEASHPASPTLAPAELAALRRVESERALAELGLAGVPVVRLGLPDGDVTDEAVQERLTPRLDAATVCLATWRGDGHPDHEAVGRAAAAACRLSGATLVEYPIWAWHWAEPGDRRVPWGRARTVALPADVRGAKHSAVACFRTQVRPLSARPGDEAILDPEALRRLTRRVETVLA